MYAIYVLIEYVLLEAEIIRIKQSLPYRLFDTEMKEKNTTCTCNRRAKVKW